MKMIKKLVPHGIYLLVLAYIIAGVLVSVHRFRQYEIFYYDFGIFDQAIWRVSRFQLPVIDHLVVGGKLIFADHFSPGIFLLAPLYWFSHSQEVILGAQAVVVGLSGYVLYRIALKRTRSFLLSFSVTVMYYLFVGLQNAVITDFHEMTVMTLPLMLTFWALFAKRIRLYFLFLLLTLTFKESTFLLGAGIAAMVFFVRPKWKKAMVATIILSAAWGYLAIKVIIPHFSGGFYQYYPVMQPTVLKNISAFADQLVKRRTLFFSGASFSFLPLLSPATWPLIGQDLLIRFVPERTNTRWDLGLHYSAQLAVILGISSVLAIEFLQKNKRLKKALPLLGLVFIANAVFLHQFVLRGPLGLAYNGAFYRHSGDFAFLDDMVRMVPEGKTVMTQNNIAAHFTHHTMWLLRDDYEGYKPDYILLDVRDGQNANNFFGGGNPESMLGKLQNDPMYEVVYSTERQFVFRRNEGK